MSHIKLQAAFRLVAEDQHWWKALTDEQKEGYIEEHPASKYADDYRKELGERELNDKKSGHKEPGKEPESTPEPPESKEHTPEERSLDTLKIKPKLGPPPKVEDDEPAVDPSPSDPNPNPKPKPKVEDEGPEEDATDEDEEDAPPKKPKAEKPKPKEKPVDNRNNGLGKGKKPPVDHKVKEAANTVKKNSKNLARSLISEGIVTGQGIGAAAKIFYRGNPSDAEIKSVAKLGATIVGSAVLAGALGASGGVGLLAFLALKHVAAPVMFNIIKSAFKKSDDKGIEKGFEYGHWEKGEWIPEPKEEHEEPEKGVKEDITGAAFRLLAVEAEPKPASGVDGKVESIVQALASYAESGDVPEEAYEAAKKDMASKRK